MWEGKRPDAGADRSIVQRARRLGDVRGVLDTQMGHRKKSGCDKSKGLFTAAFSFTKSIDAGKAVRGSLQCSDWIKKGSGCRALPRSLKHQANDN